MRSLLCGIAAALVGATEYSDEQEGNLPVARSYQSTGLYANKIWTFFGETSQSTFVNDVWSFDEVDGFVKESREVDSTDEETLLVFPIERIGSCIVFFGEYFYSFGGQDETGQCLNDIWRFDPVHRVWTEMLANGFYNIEDDSLGGRCYHHCTPSEAENQMYIYGGARTAGSLYANTIYYDFVTNTLTAGQLDANSTAPVARLDWADTAAYSTEFGAIWIFHGGRNWEDNLLYNEVWVMLLGNSSSINWLLVEESGSPFLAGHRLVLDPGSNQMFYLYGGLKTQATSDQEAVYSQQVYSLKVHPDLHLIEFLNIVSDSEEQPSGRAHFAIGDYNVTSFSFVIWGGVNSYIYGIRDTWEFFYLTGEWVMLMAEEEEEIIDYADSYWWVWLVTIPLWIYFFYYLDANRKTLITYQPDSEMSTTAAYKSIEGGRYQVDQEPVEEVSEL